MTHSELAHIGRHFYGPRWKVELSRALGVHRNMVGLWARGVRDIPDWVGERLKVIGFEKAKEWQEIANPRS